MARRPVHDRYQVQKATLDGDIGDVGAPDPIGLVDSHPFEKMRINPVHGMRHAGSRRLIDRLQAYQSHQPANPVTADANAVPPQLVDHLAAAVERVLHEQLVDPTHQRQTRRALPPERFAELRNAIMRLPGNPSRDDRAGLRHRLLHLEHTLMSARGSLDDVIIAIADANDAAL